MAAYFLALVPNPRRPIAWPWVFGAVVMLAHLAAAFHLVHHWSHAEAELDTARQTEELLGISVGAGLWVNYIFVLTWLIDAAWLLFARESYLRRPRWLTVTIQGFLGFIVFNATVVFGKGPLRWIAALAMTVLGFSAMKKH